MTSMTIGRLQKSTRAWIFRDRGKRPIARASIAPAALLKHRGRPSRRAAMTPGGVWLIGSNIAARSTPTQRYPLPPLNRGEVYLGGQVSLIACQLGRGLGPVGPPPIWVFPSISQIAVWPLVFCHRMSEPLAPMACQLVPRLATGPPPILVVPSISQIETWPLTVFCHRMSEFPSWLKSPVPTAFQLGPRLATGPPPLLVVPSISQIEACPFVF